MEPRCLTFQKKDDIIHAAASTSNPDTVIYRSQYRATCYHDNSSTFMWSAWYLCSVFIVVQVAIQNLIRSLQHKISQYLQHRQRCSLRTGRHDEVVVAFRHFPKAPKAGAMWLLTFRRLTSTIPNPLELWNKLHFEGKKKKERERVYTMFKIFSTYICWIDI